MTKVFAYLRVSGRSQADADRDGLPRQELAIKAYAAANTLTVARVFAEPPKEPPDPPG
jgi:DNA invertase Pin-like site-specific DNA recombinase